ncbi:MAG: NAD(P)H-dependent glycerol-3-phosphate dehydrogenase [Acidimicrobiia bacterium]
MIGIVGAGAWGTTLSHILSDKDDVVLYLRDKDLAKEIEEHRVNKKYLPEVNLSSRVRATSNIEEMSEAEQVVIAVPSIGFRQAVVELSFLPSEITYVSVTKGLEQQTNLRMSEVITDADNRKTFESIAVLSGPNLAHEIASGHPAATVISSTNEDVRLVLQKKFMTKNFRVYTSDDVLGCEVGGIAKNVVAIAVGIGDGFGYGDNAKAAIMTRSLAEITRLGIAMGANASTFSGLAGIGDLIATCSSDLSRNRTVGYQLGKGQTLEEIRSSSHDIAEGVFSAASLASIARQFNVDMPIVNSTLKVIQQGYVTKSDVETLMTRPPSKE